jgi:hypothetical protein
MGRWFYTGLFMPNGKTPRTVYAATEAQAREFEDKGCKPVEVKAEAKKGRGPNRGLSGVRRTRGRKKQ